MKCESLIVVLSVDTGDLSIKFCLKKSSSRTQSVLGYKSAQSLLVMWKSAKKEYTF